MAGAGKRLDGILGGGSFVFSQVSEARPFDFAQGRLLGTRPAGVVMGCGSRGLGRLPKASPRPCGTRKHDLGTIPGLRCASSWAIFEPSLREGCGGRPAEAAKAAKRTNRDDKNRSYDCLGQSAAVAFFAAGLAAGRFAAGLGGWGAGMASRPTLPSANCMRNSWLENAGASSSSFDARR